MHNLLELIEQLQTRLCNLQKSFVSIQEEFKKFQNKTDRDNDDSALRIVDILDLIAITQSSLSSQEDNNQRIIKKIERRLLDILRQWQIHEITFNNGQIEAGKVRVLETREGTKEVQPGTILETCRKGYQRGDKVIRPADVITVK